MSGCCCVSYDDSTDYPCSVVVSSRPSGGWCKELLQPTMAGLVVVGARLHFLHLQFFHLLLINSPEIMIKMAGELFV